MAIAEREARPLAGPVRESHKKRNPKKRQDAGSEREILHAHFSEKFRFCSDCSRLNYTAVGSCERIFITDRRGKEEFRKERGQEKIY